MSRRAPWRRVLGALVGVGIGATVATPARADDFLGLQKYEGPFVAGLLATAVDLTFITYDIGVAGKGELPSRGWSITETVLTTPQTAILTYLGIDEQATGSDNESWIQVVILVPTTIVSILSTHAVWTTATKNIRPSVLAGTSAAVGADFALTTGALARTFRGRLSTREVGITGMIFTAPQIAAASYLGATSPSSSRAGWIALSAWSSTLFVHGLLSATIGNQDNDSSAQEPSPPPYPSPPPSLSPPSSPSSPSPPPPQASLPRRHGHGNKAPLLVPGSLRVGPTIVSDGVASAPGLGVSGVLF